MRPTTSALIGLLSILAVANCADVSKYLDTGESVSKEETFSVDGSVYTLIYIGRSPALLLDNEGHIISDQATITRVITKHFSDLYYPSQAELNALRADLEAYDASRNNGDFYAGTHIKLPGMNKTVGMEEDVCAYSLYLNVFPCTNHSNCIYSAMMLCDELGDALNCNDPVKDLQPHVEQFSFAHNGMESSMNRIYSLLSNINPGNIYSSLSEINATIQKLPEYEQGLESSKFRLPQGGEKCKDCYGLCPRIVINESLLAAATEKIDRMLENTALLGDFNAQGARMAQEANTRLAMAEMNANKAYYRSVFEPQRAASQQVVGEARELLQVVSNGTVSSYADRAEALIARIDADINAGNFSNVNASMEELRAKTNILMGAIPAQWEIYNNTEKAKAEAFISLFILETSSLNDEQAAAVAALSARKKALDRGFVSGLTPERYIEMANGYNNITMAAEPLVQEVKQGSAYMSPFMAAGRKTNEGLESLVVSIQPMERSEKGMLAGYAPIALSALSFFSLASLLTFVFLFIFASMSSRARNRSAMFLGFAVLGLGLVAVGLVSAGVYITIQGSSTGADISDFRQVLSASDHASVIIDAEGASAGAAADMAACAGKIASQLSPRRVEIYRKTDGNCITSINTTLEDCYNRMEEPIIILKYSATQAKPEFSAVFVDSATFYGDELFFRECGFAPMLAAELGQPAQGGAAQNESSEWVIE